MKVNSKVFRLISKVVDVSFNKGKVNSAKVRQAIKTLSGLSVNNSVPALSLYLRLFKSRLSSYTLTIETANKLSSKEISSIVNKVAKTKTIYDTVITINPALRSGVSLKIGDDIIEDSLRTREEQVKEVING